MIFDHFNDDPLAEVFAAPLRAEPVTPPASYQPRDFSEPCRKCGGSGKFRNWSGFVVGNCFACKGAGKKTFRTSPEKRADNRASAAARKGRELAEYVEANREVFTWLTQASENNAKRGGTFTFPQSMLDAVAKYGSLTDNQLAAVRKCMARDEQRKVERAARVETAPVIDTAGIDRLKEAFDKAAAYAAAKATGLTIRNPKITIGGITISPAKANSTNPGALYVKAGQTYLGKIAGGKFLASRDCADDQRAQVLKFVADPAEAAKVYGQETGVCCVCNAELRSEWRLRGIGPICAEKFGWA